MLVNSVSETATFYCSHAHCSRRHHHHKGREEHSGLWDRDSDDAIEHFSDPEKVPLVLKPATPSVASVCKALDEHATVLVKSPSDESRSQREAEKQPLPFKPSVNSAQKPDTGPVEKRTEHGNRKREGAKVSASDFLGGKNDVRPCSSMATEERRLVCHLAGCLVSAAVLCAAGATLYVAIFGFVRNAAMSGDFVRNTSRAALHRLCSRTACVRALDALAENMEDGNPCTDFQRHVCGRWFSQYSRRESYEQEAIDLFLLRIHQALQDTAEQPVAHEHVTREYNMAKLYESCLNFMVEEQTASSVDVLESMGISTKTPQSVRSPGDLFRFIVGTSLSTGLPSVVGISLRSGSSLRAPFVPVVDVGQTLLVSLHYVHVSPYLEDTVADLQISDAETVIAAVTKIDEAVEAWRANVDRQEPFAMMHLRELRNVVEGASWAEALNSGLLATKDLPQFTTESAVMIKARDQIYGALATLLFSQASIEQTRVYVVLLLLAQVMKYRYLLERALERTLKDYGPCLRVTGSLTSARFTAWVTQTLVPTEAIEELSRMVESLKEVMISHPTILPELNMSDSDVAKWTVYVIGSERALHASSTTSSLPAASAPYDDRFLLNVARASRDNVFPAISKYESTSSDGSDHPRDTDVDSRTLVAWQIQGTISYDSRTRRLFVPAVWLSDITFVRDRSIPGLDFATLGVRLLAVWIRGQLAERPDLLEKLASSAECPWREVETPLDDDSDEFVRKTASTEWALRVAFLASQQPLVRMDIANDVLRDRVFFWRFCHSHCGDIINGDACGIAVRRTRSFQDAFMCREPDVPLCSP